MNTIRKDFKHGDMYITTSHRQVRHMCICGGMNVSSDWKEI